MLQKPLTLIATVLAKMEDRFGRMLTAAMLALFLFGIAMLYVQPVFTVAFHGIQFSALSENPFSFSMDIPVRYRILSPLIGYLLFLRGPLFFILPLVVSWIFIGVAYLEYRRKDYAPVDAFLFTCFIAFSCVVLLPLVAPAYTDSVTWLLIFLAFMHAGQYIVSAAWFSLALLNHESSMALLPALVLLSIYKSGRHSALVTACFIAACLPHILYRYYVAAHSVTQYDLSFYLNQSNMFFSFKKLFLFFPAAVFYAFKLWWIFPVCFIAWSMYRKEVRRPAILLAGILGAFSLMIISYDYTRMLVIAFPVVMLSVEWIMQSAERNVIRKVLFATILLNFLILQYHFNFDGAQPMFPWPLNKISAHFGMPLI